MRIRHLHICSLFVVLTWSLPAFAQQVKVTATTPSFTDYEMVNEDYSILPPFQIQVPIINGSPAYKILEQSARRIDRVVSNKEKLAMSLASDSSSIVEVSTPGWYRGQQVTQLLIHRALVGTENTSVTDRIKIRVFNAPTTRNQSQSNSKLNRYLPDAPFNQGIWYKIPITENNIYQIDADYLEELGVSLSTIDPKKIQLWGTDGYQLAELVGASRPSLQQIPIIVEGESDNRFDASDRILFYGNSPHQVQLENGEFSHSIHAYSDTNYVFLTIGNDDGQRLSAINTALSPIATVSEFTDFIWLEEELRKAESKFKSGRFWLGQVIPFSQNNTSVSILDRTIPGLANSTTVKAEGRLYARSERLTTFNVALNSTDIFNRTTASLSSSNSSRGYNGNEGIAAQAVQFDETATVNTSDGRLNLSVEVTHRDSQSEAFVDFVRLTFDRALIAEDNRLLFYTTSSSDPATVVAFQLQGFTSTPLVIDVSDPDAPKLLEVQENGSSYSLNYHQNTGLTIIAQSDFPTPIMGEEIPDQNLMGITSYPENIIITSRALLGAASDLAQYRIQQGLPTLLVTQEQIFNEFSSGVTDPTAIRDFLKFLWERALMANEVLPKYVLLFGDTSYDTKSIEQGALRNHVVTYQSVESISRTSTLGTDDYFAYMDDNEGDLRNGSTPNSYIMDLGVGRIPVQTSAEARAYIQKIKDYESRTHSGDWQNLFTFAADDDFPEPEINRDLHTINADVSAQMMESEEEGIRINKIYEFSYPVELTGAGRQVPEASKAFMDAVNEGTLVLNYSGHGNEQTLSDEELFVSQSISEFTNKNKLCILVTATCQFGRYDATNSQSGAEKFVLATNGGAIAAFTTTRIVYTSSTISSSNNFGLNIALSQRMAERNVDGSPKRLGDLMAQTKNSVLSSGGSRIGSSLNNKKFVLLGDPAIPFKLPSKKAVAQSVNGVDVVSNDTTITLRALDQVSITGAVYDENGTIDSNYNGISTVSIFDAPRKVQLPEREWNCTLNSDCSYEVERDLLFKGKSTVSNGLLNISMIIPKDISNADSAGRLVLYTQHENENSYAGGAFTSIKFMGENPNAVNDGKGPELDVYLNDEKFVNGNLVNDSPTLIIELEDESGINTTGTGVGHEIIATIDTNPEQTIVLNEFYEGNLDDFTGGRIEYPLDELPEGNYTLKVRAWDVHNNSNEKEIFFEVASQNILSVRNVYNYPNPMNNKTLFTFEHNAPGTPMDVSIKIYTLSGRPVQHIQQESIITSSSYASIPWNGLDRDYDRLGNGTYIYVLKVTADTPQGRKSIEKIEKLVIIR